MQGLDILQEGDREEYFSQFGVSKSDAKAYNKEHPPPAEQPASPPPAKKRKTVCAQLSCAVLFAACLHSALWLAIFLCSVHSSLFICQSGISSVSMLYRWVVRLFCTDVSPNERRYHHTISKLRSAAGEVTHVKSDHQVISMRMCMGLINFCSVLAGFFVSTLALNR